MLQSHWEYGNAAEVVICAYISCHQNFLSGYSRRNTFNPDERGLQHQMATDTTITTSVFLEVKNRTRDL